MTHKHNPLAYFDKCGKSVRKGNVTLQEVNEAIDTLIHFNPAKHRNGEMSMAMGMGYILIADTKGTRTGNSEETEKLMQDKLGEAFLHLDENCKCGADHRTELEPQGCAVACVEACTPAMLAIAFKLLTAKIDEYCDMGYGNEMARAFKALGLQFDSN